MHVFGIKIHQYSLTAARVADVTCTSWESPYMFTAALQLTGCAQLYLCKSGFTPGIVAAVTSLAGRGYGSGGPFGSVGG